MVVGRVLSGLAGAFLVFDGSIKLLDLAPVAEAFTRLGYPVAVAPGIGVLELACTALYLLPRTALPGAVLLTGLLGGAISTHLRVGDPWFTHTLFPLYVGALLWSGLLLRQPSLRRQFSQSVS